MAKMIVSAAGIETISGALKRPKKKDGHNHGNYLIAVHRVAETTNPNCQRIYSFPADNYQRSTTPKAAELARRNLFAQRQRWVANRAEDMQTLTQDQADFIAQKDQPGGAKTWKKYLWKLAKAQVTGN